MIVSAECGDGLIEADATAIAPASEQRVRRLEAELLAMPQVDLQTQMMLHGGMAARTILIPAGCALTGAKTNLDNVCILVGDITVTTDSGMKRLTGFHVIPACAGLKRAGYAHSDTYWTTVWPTDAKTTEDAEDKMTAESDNLQTRNLAIPRESGAPAFIEGESP